MKKKETKLQELERRLEEIDRILDRTLDLLLSFFT